ncbi:hypothetical protein V8G54_017184, partial [Vigna mungo]
MLVVIHTVLVLRIPQSTHHHIHPLLLSVSVPLSGLPRRPKRGRHRLLLHQFRRSRRRKIEHLRQHPGSLVHRFLFFYPNQWRCLEPSLQPYFVPPDLLLWTHPSSLQPIREAEDSRLKILGHRIATINPRSKRK